MDTSAPRFFENAHDMILNQPIIQNVQGDFNQYYHGDKLDALPYVQNAGYDISKQCLEDTRLEILDEIRTWRMQPGSPRILWLHGPAGTGKSAIAHTIAAEADKAKELGSYIPFDRSYVAERRHEKVFTTIARDLSARNAQFSEEVASALRAKPWLKSTPDVIQQWESLVVKPAFHLSNGGNILLVIEALDESGDNDTRRNLLAVLTRRVSELPPNIRILLTSRPLHDISQAFEQCSYVLRKDINDIPKHSVDRDIETYISSQLSGVDDVFFDAGKIQNLVRLSEGLFQWAFVACEFIRGNGSIANPQRQYFKLINPVTPRALTKLDVLYETILRSIIPEDDDDGLELFHAVMGQILGLFEPLTFDALIAMRKRYPNNPGGIMVSANDITHVIKHLGSLLSGVSDHSDPIRPIHSSFQDYILNSSRSKAFHIDISAHKCQLAFSVLEVMNAELQFNICRLESSYFLNSNVPDLQERRRLYISPQLDYCCRHWASHIEETFTDEDLSQQVQQLFNRHLLFWIEVLSLTKSVRVAIPSLSTMVKIGALSEEYRDIQHFAKDAQRFIHMFGNLISQSTPHLYLSALSFAPTSSILAKTYGHLYPRIPNVVRGRMTTWPAFQSILAGHTDGVTSVAYSPDSARIISASIDGTIRIWSGETGEEVSTLLEGVTGIHCMVISANGKYIACGTASGTSLLDANTGEVIAKLSLGIVAAVTRISWSPDSRYIACGSSDRVIHIWDTHGAMEFPSQTLKGHTGGITALAYSPDGRSILSGSYDQTLRIWDPRNSSVLRTLEGHTSGINSAVYSPSGTRIVSSSWDKCVFMWDAVMGTYELFYTHGSDALTAVSFLPSDESHIIMGSEKGTIILFNNTHHIISASLSDGHSRGITSFAFSSDGTHIVSGSWDQTVCVWDRDTLRDPQSSATTKASQSFSPGHKSAIKAIDISPNGGRMVSGGIGNQIFVWNTATGSKVTSLRLESDLVFTMALAYSPDGKRIVAGRNTGKLHTWNADTGESIAEPISGHRDTLWSIAVSPDGKKIISAARDNKICIWDAQSCTLIKTLAATHGAISPFSICQDGSRVVWIEVGTGNKFRLWDLDAMRPVVDKHTYEAHNGHISCVQFSPNGKGVASGGSDNTIRIWDGETGDWLQTLQGHTNDVKSIAFSPDGMRMATASADKTIRIWSAETSETIQVLRGHVGAVNCALFTSDGKQLISASEDKVIRSWDMLPSTPSTSTICFSSQQRHALADADVLFEGADVTGDYRDMVEVSGDGWVLGPKGRLLFCIPHMNLVGLVHPRNNYIISTDVTELDMASFAHGPNWQSCRL